MSAVTGPGSSAGFAGAIRFCGEASEGASRPLRSGEFAGFAGAIRFCGEASEGASRPLRSGESAGFAGAIRFCGEVSEGASRPLRSGESAGFAGAILPGGGPGGGRRGPLPYSDVIRERWRRPRRRGELSDANRVAEDVNPLCGDRVRMMLRVDDGHVRAARFIGDSCAICTASADVLAELVETRPTDAAAKLRAVDLLEILQADVRPTRMRCVTLPLSVLGAALGPGRPRDEAPNTGAPAPPTATTP